MDDDGLLASQQLFGIWSKNDDSDPSLRSLCALLNSPVAVAYIASHSPADRIRVATVEAIPVPEQLPSTLDELIERYIAILSERSVLFARDFAERANRALHDIDAAILESYDLPPRLEKRVLEYFRGEERTIVHEWSHWFPPDFQPFIPLRRFLSDEYKKATSGWVLEVFRPLPKEEAAALRDYLD